jgi:O-antigen ligase
MSWLRDTLKALGWATAAAAVCFCVLVSGVFGGWGVYAGVLVGVPFLAYSYHHSRRVAGLVAGWEGLFATAVVIWIVWAFRDFRFRAIQG